MIEVRSAIAAARLYFDAVFADDGLRAIRLEEVELSDDDLLWSVTFGYNRPTLGGTLWQKEYKTVRLSADTGQARAIRIRELAELGT